MKPYLDFYSDFGLNHVNHVNHVTSCYSVLIPFKVGNGGVGKSSMISRFATGIFTRDYKKTIGVDFLEKETELI